MSGDEERRTREDAVWRDIVDNYGDRARLEETPEPPVAPAPEPPPDVYVVPDVPPTPRVEDEERYVPPPPPPVPRPAPPRAVAWAGLFGVPVVILACLVATIDLPRVVDYLLLVWFVGGFLYLVATMGREPREPWDDGSRI